MKKFRFFTALLSVLTIITTSLYSDAFAAEMEDVGNLSGVIVSSDGSKIIGQDQDSQQGYKYSDGTLTDLGSLGSNSPPLGISADGSIIVGSDYTGANNAFKYTQSGGMVNFMDGETLPTDGTDTFAHSISADGSTIMGSVYGASNPHLLLAAPGYILFKYVGGTVTYPRDGLGDYIYLNYYNGGDIYPGLNPNNNGNFGYPLIPVSKDGAVFAGTYYHQDYHVSAFRYADGNLTKIGNLYGDASGYNSYSMGLSADGSTVVGWSNYNAAYDSQAFKYTSTGGLVGLGFLPGGTNSYANAVSNNGAVTVGTSQVTGGYSHAFKHTDAAGMIDLGTLGGNNSYGYSISGDGKVIVGNSDTTDGQSHAFAHYGIVMKDLGTLGSGDTSYAYSVSNDGLVIAGVSNLTPGGSTYHSFLYTFAKLIDATNTQMAVTSTSYATRAYIDLINARQTAMAGYDCSSFGNNNACLAIGGRYTASNSKFSEGASSLIASYKINDNIRLGAFIDYAGTTNTPTEISGFTNNPSLGSFLAYSQNPDNKSGVQAKFTNSFDRNTFKITRSMLANTERGSNRAKATSNMLAATIGYGFKINKKTMITPFAGLRYTKVTRAAYVEASNSDVSFPISYAKYGQALTTATFGSSINHALTSKTVLHFSAALEADVAHKLDDFSYTISSYGSYASASNPKHRRRVLIQSGLLHDIGENQKIAADILVHQQVNNKSKPSSTFFISYKLGI